MNTWAPNHSQPKPVIVQEWRLENLTSQETDWHFSWGGLLSLTRPSMTQLTEGGIIPMPPTRVSVNFDGQTLTVHNPAIRAAVAVYSLPHGESFHLAGEPTLQIFLSSHIHLKPGELGLLRFVFAFAATPDVTCSEAEEFATTNLESEFIALCTSARKRWEELNQSLPPEIQLLAHRAVSYLLDCCALPVGETICLLTDHQTLPLSWTRDAYYMTAALSACGFKGSRETVRRHLLWLYEHALRPEGHWGRAYLPNGQPKDLAFQLDQQCYPLLELVDYYQATGDLETLHRLAPYIPHILEVIRAHQAPLAHLYTTEETPGDDPLSLPYHFSSQVLLWHTLRSLSPLANQVSSISSDLESLAQAIYNDIWHYLVVIKDGQRMFAYASDLEGMSSLYHDANDLPTVLAPHWGFCSSDDPVWRATMDFALSLANSEGYYPGPFGGLGSVHTPGAWPLGDIQELIYAHLIQDPNRVKAVLSRLAKTSCWDGALAEARDPQTGTVRSRHWFAWPNCALLMALLNT